MNNDIYTKYNIYKKMTYCDYFNVKTRGLSREIENLKQCDEYCTFTSNESSEFEGKMLEKINLYPYNRNVLYVHIPFCATRCEFCPYYVEKYNRNKSAEYLDTLILEIDRIKDTPYAKSTVFQCLYFGGGTPSVLSVDEIKRLVNKIFASFQFVEGGEFTFESNAATLTEEKIIALKECGMNRVSLGIQTFNDRLLKEMNCAHNKNLAQKVVKDLLKHGMIVNVDLIFGLINQSEEELLEDINEIAKFDSLDHITYFPLRIMSNTSLEKLLYNSEALRISEHFDKLLSLDKVVEQNMSRLGFKRELASVFYHSKKSEEHKYLSTGTRVLGVGAGAGTLIDYGEYRNHDNIDNYIAAIKNGDYGSAATGPLTLEQCYERYILFSIIYLNRSLENIKEIITYNFEEYYNIPIENRYEKVVLDIVELKFAKVDEDGKILFTNRMWHVLGQVKIGMPSII